MSVWLWPLGLVYVCGMAALWPRAARRVLRYDMKGHEVNARLMRLRTPEAGTADYIWAAFGGFVLALVWPIWGAAIALGWVGILLGKWLFPALREGAKV